MDVKKQKRRSLMGRFQEINKTFFNNLEDHEFVSSSAILWNKNTTRTIDLSVMMENEIDSKNTRLSDMPNSALLSVQREKVNLGQGNKDPNLNQVSLKEDLLQVTVNSQVIVFDLSEPQPKEIMLFNATNQFMNPETFVESGIQMGLNKEAPASKNRKNGHLFDFIVATRDKTAYFHRRDRVFY